MNTDVCICCLLYTSRCLLLCLYRKSAKVVPGRKECSLSLIHICLDFLFEVGHGDIRPEVTIQVHHDVVDAAQVVKHGGKVVVVGYLGGVLFPLYFQFFGEELVGLSLIHI